MFMTVDGTSQVENLQLLKLGGSLITDKKLPHTAHLDVLSRLAQEIASAVKQRPDMKLILGHGSGSFGHVPAHQYGTRNGVRTKEDWLGFVEVWREAVALNRFVMDALSAENLPVVAFSPVASVTASNGCVLHWDLFPIRKALQAGLIPVVHGDVIFDAQLGGTILSTEDLFDHLVHKLKPQRVLLAGLEAGVWQDFPDCKNLTQEITLSNWDNISMGIFGSSATDVTGGMINKVEQSLKWVQDVHGLEVLVFSGKEPEMLGKVLLGAKAGTRIFI